MRATILRATIRILLLTLFTSAAVCAEVPPSVLIDDLTWTELGSDPSRQDHRHRADRRNRAKRPAYGARQAQRARHGAGGEDRPHAGRTRWSRRSSPTFPKAASIRPARICAFPAPSPCPTPHSRAFWNMRREASSCTDSATSFFSAITAATRKTNPRSRSDSIANGQRRPSACMPSSNTTARRRNPTRMRFAARLSRRGNRYARRPRRHGAYPRRRPALGTNGSPQVDGRPHARARRLRRSAPRLGGAGTAGDRRDRRAKPSRRSAKRRFADSVPFHPSFVLRIFIWSISEATPSYRIVGLCHRSLHRVPDACAVAACRTAHGDDGSRHAAGD